MVEDVYEKKCEILLVEDNMADVRMMEECLKEMKLLYNLYVAKDGVEALAFLRKEGKYSDAVVPNFILLDLNLPKKSGQEVLAEIKSCSYLKDVPVIIITCSTLDDDVYKAYRHQAACYIVKSDSMSQFIEQFENILKILNLPINRGE